VLYHKYSIDEKVLIPRYMALCMRPELLTVEEGLKLGMKSVIALTRTRECTRNQTTDGSGDGWRSPSPALSDKELTDIIKDHFNIKNEPTNPAGEPEPTGASTSKPEDSGASAGGTGTEPESPSTGKSGNKTSGGAGGESNTNGTSANGTGANRRGKAK